MINNRPLTLGPEGSYCLTPNDLIHHKLAQDPEGDLFDPLSRKEKLEQAFNNWVKIFEATVNPRENHHRAKPRPILKKDDIVVMTDTAVGGKMTTAKVLKVHNPRRYTIVYMRNNKRVQVDRHITTLALIERPGERQDQAPLNPDCQQ